MTSLDDLASKMFKKIKQPNVIKTIRTLLYVKLIQFHGQILKSNNKCTCHVE